jgi:colanic acid/amylovoran biosynthesis glycosyltransferase
MRIVVLLTKNYPFGKLETYLNNEIPILAGKADKLIIVPVDEYQYTELNPLCSEFINIEILAINKSPRHRSLKHKVLANISALKAVITEIAKGREGMLHLKRWRFCMTYFKVAYQQSVNLFDELNRLNLIDQPMVLYNYWLHKSTIVSALFKRQQNRNVSIVSRSHSSDLYHKDWFEITQGNEIMFVPFEHFKLVNCDKIYSISTHGLNHFQRTFPALKDKFDIARLGVVNQNELTPFDVGTTLRIATCSAIQARKRIERIPKILSLVQDLNIEWVHFGSGETDDLNVVNQEIAKYGLENRVKMFGHVSHQFILEYYRTNQINLIINLSYAEGIPVSLMEAISFGIPGIATETVGNPEIIDNTCGFIIPIEFDANQVADYLREFASNKELRLRLRKGALEMFRNKYTASSNYNAFSDTLLSYCN